MGFFVVTKVWYCTEFGFSYGIDAQNKQKKVSLVFLN